MRLLKNPPFELRFSVSPTPARQPHIRLQPDCGPDDLYDTVRDEVVGQEKFTAIAYRVPEHNWWVVCTGVGAGWCDLRFRHFTTEEEAAGALVKWFWRRFRRLDTDGGE